MPLVNAYGERRHVRAEQRQQEHHRTERTSGEEVLLDSGAATAAAPGEDADIEDDRQIGENDDGGDQRR
jgi:hypothetical protein